MSDLRLAAVAAYLRGDVAACELILELMEPDARWEFCRTLEGCSVRVLEVHFRLRRQQEQPQPREENV
jgi:hypothetical protein